MINYVLISLIFIGIGYYEIPDLLSEKQGRAIIAVVILLVIGLILSYMGAADINLSNQLWFDLSDTIIKTLHIKWPY